MVGKLRSAYYPDLSDSNLIQNGNIDLMSDMHFADSILTSTILQAIANNRKDCHNHKNTFLYRCRNIIYYYFANGC